jgi:hypothetical protein
MSLSLLPPPLIGGIDLAVSIRGTSPQRGDLADSGPFVGSLEHVIFFYASSGELLRGTQTATTGIIRLGFDKSFVSAHLDVARSAAYVARSSR